jgi:hypothetical protein
VNGSLEATVAEHFQQPCGSQPRMLLERLLNEIEKRRGGERPRRARLEALGFERAPNGVGMEVEFGGDGADLPMLGEEEAANGGNLFGRDHRFIQDREKD